MKLKRPWPGPVLFAKALMMSLVTLMLLTGRALAAIAVQDGSTAISHSASATISQPFTVTPGASVLVVLETDRGASGTPPAALSYGTQTMRHVVTTSAGSTFRNLSIFYLFNPAVGTNNITGTAQNASVWLSAFTLNGVDTSSLPVSGAVASGGSGVTSVRIGLAGIPAGGWAVVNGVYASDVSLAAFTITGTGGTTFISTNASDSSYENMGYITNLAAGTDTFLYSLTAGGAGVQKMALVTVVFSPLVANGPPVVTAQPHGQMNYSGFAASFAVGAIGHAPLAYQWRSNGTNLVDGSGINGSRTNKLNLSNLNAGESGNYTVVITNVFGSVTSTPVPLNVIPINGSGGISVQFVGAGGGSLPLTSLQSAGLHPFPNWNLDTQGSGQIMGPLVDDAGVVTFATITVAYGAGQYYSSDNTSTPDGILNSGGFWSGSGYTVTVTGIPYTNYDVYTYMLNDNNPNRRYGLTLPEARVPTYWGGVIEGNTMGNPYVYTPATDTTEAAVPSAETLANCVHWTGVNGTNITITGQTPDGNVAMMGIQIVGTAASAPTFARQPTPATTTSYVGGIVTFSAVVDGTAPISLQWQHDGTNLPNATTSTLTLANLGVGSAGSYTLYASNYLGTTSSAPAVLTVLSSSNAPALNVLTYHYDNTRQGANTNEVVLTLANVTPQTFGRLFTYPVDGHIYAQPLYVNNLAIPGQGVHNVVFVATEHDTVYAFDADSNGGANGGLLWSTNLGTYAVMPNNYFANRYGAYHDLVPAMGITSTPVIDPVAGTIYVDAFTQEGTGNSFRHRIHALSITNGAEKSYSPVIVAASVPGRGVDSVNGVVTFNAEQELQRPALTLAGGYLYVSYSSYADTDPYHGWILGYNATNLMLETNRVFNTTPNATLGDFGANAGEGGLWMGGNGLSVDADTNLYFEVGNGSFSANTNGGDFGDSFVKLSTSSNRVTVADYFTPYYQATLQADDEDLGSSGPLLLPDSVGNASHPHLLVGAGKEGKIHLVDRDNMGRYHATDDDQVVQEVASAIGPAYESPAYFNYQLYYQGDGDVLKSFAISNAVINPTPLSESAESFGYHGSTPVISANGLDNAIAWVTEGDLYASGGPAILHAYNATNLAQELYNSSMDFTRDDPGAAVKFTVPTVINGKVYVGAEYALSVFGTGIFAPTPTVAPAGGPFKNSVTITIADSLPGATFYYTLDGTIPTTGSRLYTGPFTLTNSALVLAIATAPGEVNSGAAGATYVNSSETGAGTGLLGRYWANTTGTAFTNIAFTGLPTLTRTDATVNFDWNGSSPDPSVGQFVFAAQWTGCVQPQFSQTYTFYGSADDGVLVWVNGELLADGWMDEGQTTYSGSITLQAQQLYNIEMDYYQDGGGAVAQLLWSSPSVPEEIIPQSQLYPFTNPPPAVVLTAPVSPATNYTASASVTVSADADAPYNTISSVGFYANGTLLGSVSNAPYTLTATGLGAGHYALTAVATDGSGLSTTSAPVKITVTASTGRAYGLTTNGMSPAFFNMPVTFNGALPPLLSLTGVYGNTPGRVPASGLIPYVPNTPLWSDGAVKSRYMSVPGHDGGITPDEQIGFAPTGSWSFPSGTIFIKNFDLVVNATNPSVPLRRLETRLLVRDINGQVYGVTYKWRPDNSDADLLGTSSNEDILITNATGVSTQTWYYPSPADCLSCHTPVANYVLGVNTRQLNGNLTYPATGVADNQLRTLNRLGLFNPAFDEAGITNFEALSAVTNLAASPAQRGRSYLDANCAQCHQPGGTGITFDARYDTPLTNQNIINVPAAHSLGFDNACVIKADDVWRSMIWERMNTTNPATKMPSLGHNLVDTNGVAAMASWINSLPGTPALAPPVVTPNGGSFYASETVAVAGPNTNATVYYTLDGSLPSTNSARYAGAIILTNSATVSANAFAAGYNNSVVASAVFTRRPAGKFSAESFANNGVFQLQYSGIPGSNYVLQATTNFIIWTPLSTNQATNSLFEWFDPKASNFPFRFYRVLGPQP